MSPARPERPSAVAPTVPDDPHDAELIELARALLDGNRYLVLATIDAAGYPWTSPVYFSHVEYGRLLWMSHADAQHSVNLVAAPRVSVVVFDSQVEVGRASALYATADAYQVRPSAVAEALAHYPGEGRGARRIDHDELVAPSPFRLYEATMRDVWLLCPRAGSPCVRHGLDHDHRVPVWPPSQTRPSSGSTVSP
jgi:hypothetical protein